MRLFIPPVVALTGVVWVASCDDPPPADSASDPAVEVPPIVLGPVESAVRISMALRGVRPTFDELDAVVADPAVLPDLIEDWLSDPNFGATVRDITNEAFQLRSDSQLLDGTGSLSGFTLEEIDEEVQEAPMRLVEQVVLEDRRYHEIITSDYAVANEVVFRAWTGLEPYDVAGDEYQNLQWVDGRPAAGILSDSSVWVRWRSAGANAQRGRANLVARALLCEDFLKRDATIDSSAVADPTGGTSLESPGCAGCHKSLDPLASFFPFVEYPMVVTFVFPIDLYDETYESREGWQYTTGVPPNYWGLGGENFEDFVASLTTDPRFHRCAASRIWSFLNQEELEYAPAAIVDRLQATLDETESAKTVFREVVSDPAFTELDGVAPHPFRIRAEVVPRMFEDLTGFTWKIDGANVCCSTAAADLGIVDLGNDAYRGWVVLWGGIDGPYLAHPTHTSSTTSALILEEYAQLAAAHVVSADLAEPDPEARHLLRWVEADTTDEAAVRTQLSRLHLRILGEEVAPDDTDDAYTLFTTVLASAGDPARAWEAVLTAMLSDDRVEYY